MNPRDAIYCSRALKNSFDTVHGFLTTEKQQQPLHKEKFLRHYYYLCKEIICGPIILKRIIDYRKLNYRQLL